MAKPKTDDLTAEGADLDARPDWLPENFETPEAFVGSWKESQAELTRTKQSYAAERDQLLAQIEELQTVEQAPPAYDAGSDPLLLMYEQAVESGDARAQLAIQSAITQQITARAVETAVQQMKGGDKSQLEAQNNAFTMLAEREVASKYEDWADKKPKVIETLTNYPRLLPEKADPAEIAQALELVYKMVKAEELVGQQQSIAEQQAELQQRMKEQAQTMGGASGRPPSVTEDQESVARIMAAAKGGSYASVRSG